MPPSPVEMSDTIVALSSGRPPAALAVIRVSGPAALPAVTALAGALPLPRRAGLRALRDENGALLDRALVLVFPAPGSATGEDLVELHCHGGRAVVAAVEAALCRHAGLRIAEPGEFTRRAVMNGRLDLAEAEGLADLLEAETESQRRAALAASEGQVSRALRGWMDRIAGIAALIEASIDFAEEDDVAGEQGLIAQAQGLAASLHAEMTAVLASPPVDRVRDGVRVVLAGPPNSGKSTLLNLLAARDAAIVSPQSGTTRDRIDVHVQRGGVSYLLTDTAGLTETADAVERIGVARAEEAIVAADVLLWLGDEAPPRVAIRVHARADLPDRQLLPLGKDIAVRQDDPRSVDRVWDAIARLAERLLPSPSALPLKQRQQRVVNEAVDQLTLDDDAVIAAEQMRLTGQRLGSLLGIDATEAMLDALFGRFCLGK